MSRLGDNTYANAMLAHAGQSSQLFFCFSHQDNQCRHPGSERTPDSEIGGKDEEEEEIEEERGRGGAGALPEPVGWPLEEHQPLVAWLYC